MAKLGDIATYINGYAFKPSDWSTEGLPIIRIQDLTGSSYKTNKYNGDYDKKYEVNNGDILISWSASLGVFVWKNDKAVLNQHIFKVIFNKKVVDKDFFVYQVENILRKAQNSVHGATMKHLTKPVFDSLDFYLPLIEEQKRIAKQLKLINLLIDHRNDQIKKLDLLVKSRFIEMFGDESTIVKMENICSIITDGTHQPPKFVGSGIPFLFVSNISSNEIRYDAEKFISDETYAELYKRTPIEIGDVILSTVGSYGHPAIVKSDKKFLFQRHIAYLKPKKNMINSVFLHTAILSDEVKEQIDRKVKGIAQKTLNLSDIRSLNIILPNIDKQNQFASFVTQVDKSKLAIQQSLDELETLKKSLMQQYFG